MTILEYYSRKQQNKNWEKKFMSTSYKQSGKVFSYVNTNFRGIYSFINQVQKFNSKNGLPRSEWNDKQRKGQEKDKHRINNLLKAGFFELQNNVPHITAKGIAVLDLIEMQNLNKEEKWLLLYLLLLDYKNENNIFEILNSTKETYYSLKEQGFLEDQINVLICKALPSKKNIELFAKDIFWLITFQKDDQFLELFSNSRDEDKYFLYDYVIKNFNEKNKEDFIAHKYTCGGVYTFNTFIDDLKVLYLTNIFLNKNENDFNKSINLVINEYSKICYKNQIDNKLILKFIKDHNSIYKNVFTNLINYHKS